MSHVLDQTQVDSNKFELLQKGFKAYCSKLHIGQFINVMVRVLLHCILLLRILTLDLVSLQMQKDYAAEGLQGIWLPITLLSCYLIFSVILLYSALASHRVRKNGLPNLRKKLAASSLVQELDSESTHYKNLHKDLPPLQKTRMDSFMHSDPDKQVKELVFHLNWFLEKPKHYYPHGLLIIFIVVSVILYLVFSYLPNWEYLSSSLGDGYLLTLCVLWGVWYDRKCAQAVELKKYLCPDGESEKNRSFN